jgi:hypothetical protein
MSKRYSSVLILLARSLKLPLWYSLLVNIAHLFHQLVLNGFASVAEKHVELMKVTWKEIFPSLPVDKVNLDNCRRVVLVNFEPSTGDIEFRHYLIQASRAGVNKVRLTVLAIPLTWQSIKKVIERKVTDLSEFNDISEYVLQYDFFVVSMRFRGVNSWEREYALTV